VIVAATMRSDFNSAISVTSRTKAVAPLPRADDRFENNSLLRHEQKAPLLRTSDDPATVGADEAG
jgi:hypothetical protein